MTMILARRPIRTFGICRNAFQRCDKAKKPTPTHHSPPSKEVALDAPSGTEEEEEEEEDEEKDNQNGRGVSSSSAPLERSDGIVVVDTTPCILMTAGAVAHEPAASL
jgi:hypothetical protein